MSGLPDRPGAKILRADDAACWIDGMAFLARARAQGEEIRAAAAEQVAEACRRGEDEGRRAGEMQAARLLADTAAGVDRYLARIERELVLLATGIVSRLLDGFDDAALIAAGVRKALLDFRGDQAITVSVAPEMLADVEALLAADTDRPMLRVTADRHLSGRQCLIAGPAASMDVSLDAQLTLIRDAMLTNLEETRP